MFNVSEAETVDSSEVGQPSSPDVTNPQPAPSTPTQPGGEPQKHPNDPIQIDPDAPVKNPNQDEADQQKEKEKSSQGSSDLLAGGSGPSTPKYKYKVDGKELDMPEWIKPFVTPENEQNFSELFERSQGVETIKERYKQRSEEFVNTKTELDTLKTDLTQLSKYLNNNDFGAFLEATKIPKELVFKYVQSELKLANLPPEERAVYEQQQQERQKNYYLEQQYQQLQQQMQQHQSMMLEQQLQSALSRPEVSAVNQSFDARVGKVGAFRDEVIKRAILIEQTTGQSCPPERAVSEVLSLVGGNTTQAGQGPAMPGLGNSQGNAQFQANPQQGRPPVIPNIQGHATSPTARTPKSLDELRKLYQQSTG